jgi:hypothetical protein
MTTTFMMVLPLGWWRGSALRGAGVLEVLDDARRPHRVRNGNDSTLESHPCQDSLQSGFDEDFVRGGGEAFWIHSEHIFADLELFLRTGVIGRRAWRSLVWLGFGGITTSYGVVVDRVASDTWADRIGLREGDVLLTVDGAPLFSTRDLGTVQRLVTAGGEVAATWARAGEHRAEAAIV